MSRIAHLGVVSYFLKMVSSDSGGGSRGRNPGGNPRPRMKRPEASNSLQISRGQKYKYVMPSVFHKRQ